MSIKQLIFIHILLCAAPLFSLDYHDYDARQHTVAKATIEKRLPLLIHDSELQAFYRITDDAFILYASEEDKKNNCPEFTFYFGEAHREASIVPQRIAIDPGHYGGKLAGVEKRLFSYKSKSIREGDLTLFTALKLKKLLEEKGYEVFITRREPGKAVYPISFEAYQKSRSDKDVDTVAKEYNAEDLQCRASFINAFHPDLTVCIHYNIGEKEPPQKGVLPALTKENHTFVYVPGAFCLNELDAREKRIEFMRLLVSEDIDRSIALASALCNRLRTFAPLAEMNDVPSIQKHISPIQPGVFARNLCLTRTVHCPVAYCEALIMNSEAEFDRLAACDSEVDNLQGPKRAFDVAYTLLLGIQDYIDQTTNK